MAQMFKDEAGYPDNNPRQNFVFLGYPFNPPLAGDDYAAVVRELQQELPIRLWYFLDEITTDEMMRKIWRAILRSDLAIFDISGGNPNVAFELGLAVGRDKRCMTVLKAGEPNPLGSADLGYSERMEYSSAETLKARLRDLLTARSGALRLIDDVSYSITGADPTVTQEVVKERLRLLVTRLFNSKSVTKATATSLMKSEGLATSAIAILRAKDVLQIEGAKRGARYVFTSSWVYHDHEVAGI